MSRLLEGGDSAQSLQDQLLLQEGDSAYSPQDQLLLQEGDSAYSLQDQLDKLSSDPISGVNRIIYRGEPALTPPSDVDPLTGLAFSPVPFAGPARRAARLHGFPRGGYTNDIAALSSYGTPRGVVNKGGKALAAALGGARGGLSEDDPPILTTKSYTKEEANDYVRGIACAGIMVLCVYVLWGVWLLLLRVGRTDCCFRLCDPGRRRRGKGDPAGEDEAEDGEAGGGADRGCWCAVLRDSIIAKGGCCFRHVFCGWCAGKPVVLPTRGSLEREEDLRRNGLGAVADSVKSAGNVVMGGVTGRNKSDAAEEGVGEAHVAEEAVPATEEGPEKPPAPTVTEEYVQRRQESARRTILALRISFLISAALVLAFSSALLAQGWKGINSIVDTSKDTLVLMEDKIDGMLGGVDDYIRGATELKRKREQFVETVTGGVDPGGQFSWCPSLGQDGRIEINVSLSRLLLKGNLIKLALVDEDAEDESERLLGATRLLQDGNVSAAAEMTSGTGDAAGAVEGAGSDFVETAKEKGSAVIEAGRDAAADLRGKAITVVTFLDRPELGGGGLIGKVLGLKDELSGEILGGDDGGVRSLVERVRAKVRSVVTRAKAALDGPASRGLRDGSAIDTVAVAKDGVEYVVLQSVDALGNPIEYGGGELIVGGYNLTELLTTNITLTVDIPSLSRTTSEALDKVSDQVLDRFEVLHDGLITAKDGAASAQATLDSILPYYYVAVVFVSIIMLLTCFFAVGVVLAWKNKSHWLFQSGQDYVLCPIFIVCGLLVWIFTVVFLTLGVLSGDFCVVNPDVQVSKMLEQTLRSTSTVAFNFAYYYTNSCPTEFEPTLLARAADALDVARGGIGQVFSILSNLGAGPLSVACGINAISTVDAVDNPFEAMNVLSDVIREQIVLSTKAAFGLLDLALCRSISPLYTALVHDIVCTDAINMIGPMLWSLFFISIFSMVMVTLRVAWHTFLPDGDEFGRKSEVSLTPREGD